MDQTTIETEITDNVIGGMKKQTKEETDALVKLVDTKKEDTSKLNTSLQAYNVLSYIKKKEIEGIKSTLNGNLTAIETLTNETLEAYRTYAEQTKTVAQTNQDLVVGDVETGNERFNQAISKELTQVLQSRNANYKTNATLLNNFILKLPYTRQGKDQLTKVYQFILKPVEFDQVKPTE